MGTLLAGQMVFSVIYLIVLILMFIVFYYCKIPLGLGG